MGDHYPDPQTQGKGCRLRYAPLTLPKHCPLPVGPLWLTLLAALGRASPQTVLQQLVGAGRAGACHQAHGSLMEEDLEVEGKVGWRVRGGLAQG